MAKTKPKRQQATAAAPPSPPASPPAGMVQINLGYDPTAKIESRDIVEIKEGWSEYTLQDGSVLRVKASILDVKRVLDQYGPDGNPLYVMQFAFVNQLVAPDHLKKKS